MPINSENTSNNGITEETRPTSTWLKKFTTKHSKIAKLIQNIKKIISTKSRTQDGMNEYLEQNTQPSTSGNTGNELINRNTNQSVSTINDEPPTYEEILKQDKETLPTYQEAMKFEQGIEVITNENRNINQNATISIGVVASGTVIPSFATVAVAASVTGAIVGTVTSSFTCGLVAAGFVFIGAGVAEVWINDVDIAEINAIDDSQQTSISECRPTSVTNENIIVI